jgi:hypothetical protein
MARSGRRMALAAGLLGLATVLSTGCGGNATGALDLPFIGGNDGGNGDGGQADVPQNGDGGRNDGPSTDTVTDLQLAEPPSYDPDAFFINDPPPQFCPLDGGTATPPPVPGGTPDCPDDKNRQGCPCPEAGLSAACWPGARINRNLGICMDGTTVCQPSAEGRPTWGPCEGYVLPQDNAVGANACECFSRGVWSLDNLSPCFIGTAGGQPGSGGAISTVIRADGQAECPASIDVQPSQPWTPNALNVDCSGHFRLCYTLKAGDGANPQPTDCTLVQVCSEADYIEANTTQPFPDLDSWLATSPEQQACAMQFVQVGGYGEMSVQGLTVACDELADRVFLRVTYCPLECNMPNPPAMCAQCRQDGSGEF